MNTETLATLLDAAIASTDPGLTTLSLDEVAATLGCDVKALKAHFADDEALAIALHARHLETMAGRIAALIDGMPAGRSRLQVAIEQFWDVCLGRLAFRRLIRMARRDPVVNEEIDRRSRTFVFLLIAELTAMGAPDSPAMAPLVYAMTEAISSDEMKAGHKLPALRAALWHLLDHDWN